MNQRLTLLTTSCKYYEDVLDIHEKLYSIHWNDCPYPRYLVMDEITEGAEYLKKYDKIIVTGKETGKKNHERITRALEQIHTQYVMFLQEDMLLCSTVDAGRIERLLNIVEKDNLGALRLMPFYGATEEYGINYEGYDDLVVYPKGTPYRVSYAPTIWNKEYLLKISRQFEYGADFERKGSVVSDSMSPVIAGYKFVAYPYINGILRGKWEIPAVRYLGYYKIEPDFTKHHLMTAKDIFKQGLMGYIYNLNPKMVLKVQNKTKIGKSY